jgi:hypothetical protein
MPKFDDGKKTKKRKKIKKSDADSEAQKAKIKNTIEIIVIFVGIVVFAIMFFKDTLFSKREEEKPVEVVTSAKDNFIELASNAFSYQTITNIRRKIFSEYKYGEGSLKFSSEAISMKELDYNFKISLESAEAEETVPWFYAIGNGTYDNEKLFYSDLSLYYKNNNVFFWIPKTSESDIIDENRDKFFMEHQFMLDKVLRDDFANDFDMFIQLINEYMSSNFDELYFNSRIEGDAEVYQLKLDGTAIRDLAYILLPKLQADNSFNAFFVNLFGVGIDYIYFMGDPEEYDENDENNEVYERVEDLAPNYSVLVDIYKENSVANKIYIEFKDAEKTYFYTMIFDSDNYDVVYSYKNNNSDNVVQVFHGVVKINGDEYAVFFDYGKAYKFALNISFFYEDKLKLPNLVAIRNYWNQEEKLQREIQYRFEKSPGIAKFKKDTGMNLDFIFNPDEQ